MADKNIQNEFDELIKQLKNLGASTREINSMKKAFDDAAGSTAQATAEIQRMKREIVSLESQAAAATLPIKDLTTILAANASELQNTGKFITKVANSFNVINDIGNDILYDSIGITDLSRKQLTSKIQTLKVQREILRTAKATAEIELKNLKTEIAKKGKATATQATQLKQLEAIIKYNADQDDGLSGVIEKTNIRLELEDKIERKMGVTGALVEGTGALMERLGMRSGIFHTAMEQAAQEMRDMSRAAAEGTENFSRLEIISKGLSTLFGGFSKALLSLEGVGIAIAQAFLDVNKAATEAVHLTGQNAVFTQGLNTRLATTQQYLETIAELTKQTGMNAQNIFSNDVLQGAAELQNTMGLAANEAGGLAMIAQTTSGDIDGVTSSIVDTTSAFNRANRSAVSQGQILRDVATTSDGIKASFSGMPKQLGLAAAAARRLGMSLSELDSVASSLLDFESSIEAELEAQLLTGRQMNLGKARELALNNDLAGVGKEIFKNSASIAQFGKMNRIQQEAQAKALGLTRDQLGKIAYQRGLENNMTSEQAALAAGVKKEDMERMAIQEKIQLLMGKLAQSFAPILEALVPIVEMLGSIIAPVAGFIGYLAQGLASLLKFEPIMFTLKALTAAVFGFKFASFIGGLITSGKSIATLTAQMTAFAAAKAAGLKDKQILAGFGGKAAKDATQMTMGQTIALKLNNAVTSRANKIKLAYGKTTKYLSGRITALSTTIKGSTIAEKLNTFATDAGNKIKKIAVGTYNLLTTASIRNRIATMASTVAEKAKIAAEKISLLLSKSRIGQYIAERAAIVARTAATWLGIGAQKSANAAAAIASTTGAAGGAGMAAFALGLGALAPTIPVILAIAAALLMASPAIYAIGTVITGLATVIGDVLMKALEMLPSVINAVATGFTMMLGAITFEKIAALLLMGPALTSVAFGLAILTSSIFSSLPAIAMLGAIALMGTGLMNAGNGVKIMAEGVAKLSEALKSLETDKLEEVKDLISTTALAAPAIAATGAITSLIQGIAGTGGDSNNGDNTAKLDELIAAVKSGANVRVYLDSDDITKRTVIESTTLS